MTPRSAARGASATPSQPAERTIEHAREPPSARTRWSRFAPYTAVAVLAVAVYANTLRNAFVYDDQLILHSPLLHEPWNLAAIFDNRFRPEEAGRIAVYRPLNDWSHLLNYRVSEWVTGSGDSRALFHALNVVLHASVACLALAWFVALGLTRRIACTAAIFFAVLPIHTEAVANITGRSECQAALLGLSFAILHRRGRTFAAALAYIGALLCKESAIAFLPLVVASDFLSPPREANTGVACRRKALVQRYATYAAIAAAWLVLRGYGIRRADRLPTIVQNPLYFAPLGQRLLTAARVQLDYLRLQLLPIELSSDYSMNQIPLVGSVLDPRVLAFVALLAGAIVVAWRARRRTPMIALGVVGYAILFSTTSNFLVPIGTIMGERLAYAPSLCFCVLFAIALWSLERRIGARAVAALIVVLVAIYGTKTVAQNRVWRDDLTLFAEQARTAPSSAKAHAQYGNALSDVGRDRDAIAEYERSLAIHVYKPEIFVELGNALSRVRADPERCIAAYRGAIALMPGHLDARAGLASALIGARRLDEAVAEMNEIRARDPRHPSLGALEREIANATK
jgi:tetratricopeptide (TPR) repeat protein